MRSRSKSAKTARPIVVKRRRPETGLRRVNAWKIAYADFVTAMMAFFIVMWLIAEASKDQQLAVFGYFHSVSMDPGQSNVPPMAHAGPGGISTAPVEPHSGTEAAPDTPPMSATAVEEANRQLADLEHRRLEALLQTLRQAIDQSQALKPFKDQLLLEIAPEGLRIQIVDELNRPMFDRGSAKLKDYTVAILRELAVYLNTVSNRVTISGHTDTTPYIAQSGFTNWDLSTDRANAARRALEQGGLEPDKISRVVGFSSLVLFDPENPRDPINRRISIVVMTKEAEAAALKTEAEAPTWSPGDDAAMGEALGAPVPQDPPAPAPAPSESMPVIAPKEIPAATSAE